MVDPNFATKVEIPFSFFFFSFGKVGERGIHVEMNFLSSGILEGKSQTFKNVGSCQPKKSRTNKFGHGS